MGCFILFILAEYVVFAMASVPVSAKQEGQNPVASLMALKAAVRDDPSSALQDWNQTSQNFCKWKGINCHPPKRGVVIGIDLRNMSLRGFIPPELGNLSSLQFLDLSHNGFMRHIPSALGRLGRLKELQLSMNKLGGSIPPELGNLGSLQILSSYGNGHTGTIPATLGNCSMLEGIDLSENNLTGTLPPELGILSRLQIVRLDNNFIAGGIPPSFFNCTGLRNLSLSFNLFSGPIPSDIGVRLPQLEGLLLAWNNLTGSIPKSLGNCSCLSFVELTHSKLGGVIPQELGRLSRLIVFNAPVNKFISGRSSGPIPILEALSNCSKLQKLDLSASRLTGALPASIGKLSGSLAFLNLEKNNIGGSIPRELGNLSALIVLYMGGNSLVGTIPSEMGNLLNLVAIDLSSNKLQGNIPTEIQKLHGTLQYMYMSDNKFSGLIPDTAGKLDNLRELNLSMNSFYGSIPQEIGQCILLESLDLCCNNLSGTIPSEVANLRNLNSFFDLSGNALTGLVPAEIGGMQMVQGIDLSANKLSGRIPSEITGLVGVMYLNLSYNHLRGVLPLDLGQKLSLLMSLDLSHNNITGPVPSSISKLEMLILLNLSHNNFTGKISCGGAFNKLENVSLIGNPGLCGNCMGLTACLSARNVHNSSSKKHRKRKILIASFVGLFGVLCCIGFGLWMFSFLRKNRTDNPLSRSSPARTPGHPRITMEELRRATENYSSANLIGVGSYGSVYRGILSSGETVAVKVFAASNSDQAEKSFLTECQTLGQVRHRNLVKIITSCSTADFKALVTEFMAKGSLDQHLHGEEDQLSLERRLSILCDVGHGMSYLHHDCCPPIVHCDLKPQNVVVDETMTGHVADFGIARLFSPTDDAPTTTSALKGTVGYIPPEYGFGGRISTSGDVYGFGILILEMLTQKRPTDPIFTSGLTLTSWVSTKFSNILQSCVETIPFEVTTHSRGESSQEALKYSTLEGLLQLGLWCTSEAPENRPTMRVVESVLANISNAMRSHNQPID